MDAYNKELSGKYKETSKNIIMKQYLLYTVCTLLMLSLAISSFGQGIVTMDIRDFKEKNDSLILNYKVNIPSYIVETGQGLRISPILEAGDSIVFLPRVTILGGNKHKVLNRYHKNSELGNPPTTMKPDSIPYDYQIRLPYQMWMDTARLCIRQEVAGYRGAKVVTRYLLSDRVDLAPRTPYRVNPQVSYIVPEKEEKRRKRQGKAYLDFQVGRSVILPDFRRNPEELQKINDVIQEVVSNKDVSLEGLYVEGYASPEAPYSLNERLSRDRAAALKDYLKNRYSLDESLLKVSAVAEDWSGLEALVQASDMKDKDKVLQVITSQDAPDSKEAALKRVAGGVPYRYMLKEMFPELRRVEYQVDYSVRDYGVEETKALVNSRPIDLSQKELYDLAQLYGKESKEYSRILTEIIPRYFADDAVANNNASAYLLNTGETLTSSRHLEKAGETGEALNNRGVLYLLKGDLEKADKLFEQAERAGIKEATHNRQEVQTKLEDNTRMERYKK